MSLVTSNAWQVGNGSADGLKFPSGVPIGFYGATPAAQRSGAAQAAVTTTAATTTSPAGYTTTTQANAIVTLVNELRAAMVAVGLIAGA